MIQLNVPSRHATRLHEIASERTARRRERTITPVTNRHVPCDTFAVDEFLSNLNRRTRR